MDARAEKIRKARQTRVEHNGKVFVVRRPTYWEASLLAAEGGAHQMDILTKFVVGWERFTDADLFPGGDTAPAEFSSELFVEWAQDNPEYWNPITSAISDEYKAHKDRLEAAEKK
jgi:hypothetical protein